MSETKRTFLQGKMNKDLDERIVPDGQYVDALNIQIAKSEGSDVGAIENTLGNDQRTFHGLTNAKCIRAYADNSNQLIYYFVTADEKDFVAEYDDKSQSTTMLLESTRVNGKTLLNFQTDKLITGIVKVISGTNKNDLLAWTDDNEQPRIINIERAKGYGVDGFEEDDISLIKKPPLYAPTAKLTYTTQSSESNINDKFLSFAYAYRYLDGEMSALSPFTTAAFSPNKFKLDYQTFENEGMQNMFSAVDIEFNTGSKRVTDIVLVFKESNSNAVYVVETFHKKDYPDWKDNESQSFRFSNSKIYRMLDENELFRLFDNVPRKAKAMDLIGNRIALGNYLEGNDLENKFGEKIKLDYELSLFTKDLSGDPVPYELLTLNADSDMLSMDLSGISLKQNTRLRFLLDMVEKTGGTGTYSGSFDFILNEDFQDATKLAADQDFIMFISDIVTKGFLADYTTTPPENSEFDSNSPFTIDSSTPTSITLKAPTITYQIDNTPNDGSDDNFSPQTNSWGFLPQTEVSFKNSATDASCKTNRSYEVAMVYLDEYGRATTALTSPYNTLYVPQRNSIYQNKIRINVNHQPPHWAKYFRFAIKQNKKEYQTIYASVFYEDGLFRWVKLDGANKDKVKEGDTLIVKSDLSGQVPEVVKVRVLDVKTKPQDFLEENLDATDKAISEEEGIYMKIKVGAFDMNYTGETFKTVIAPLHKTKKSRPTIVFKLGEKNADGVYEDYAIPAGTNIAMEYKNWIELAISSDPEVIFTLEKIAADSYDNFQQWFEAENITFGDKAADYGFTRNSAGELELHVKGTLYGAGWEERSKMAGSINFRFTEGMVIFETEPEDALSDVYFEGSQTFKVIDGNYHEGNIQSQTTEDAAVIELEFFNCYALGNSVESYRYKDALNSKYLNIDTRPTAKSASEYREIRRYADITYSEAFVENLGINGLNNFNLSKANYKDDIVKKYGSIQKLIARDTDLILFQEDKVSRVLYGKELIVGPDGDSNIAAVDHVLGSQIMYAGEHGVSRNPESIATAGSRIWFADEKRNQVCRLGGDGITVISDYGLSSFFRDMFTNSMNRAKIAAYDPYSKKYTLNSNNQIVYNPEVKFDCSQSVKKENYVGTFKADVDFDITTGQVGVNFTTDKEITVKLIWNGVTYETTSAVNGSLMFNKTDMLPRTAELIVEAANEGTTFEISGNCAIVEQFTVISIVNGSKEDAGKIIDNRYKWVFNNYSAPYKHFRKEFIEGGGITLFNKETGDEGTGYIPKTGSKLLLESFKGYGDTGSFGEEDTLGYLVSNTEYTKADYDTIKSQVTEASPVPITTEGGETINRMEFNVLRPNAEKFLYLLWDYSALSININTYIFIYFDSSGSMNSTLAPLQEMRDTILKDALLPLYENDSAAYDEKVQVLSHSSERTLHMLNFLNGVPPEGNVISLVFQDEAHTIYHGLDAWTINDARTTTYNSDISAFRNRLNSFAANYYRGVLFQVETGTTDNYGAFQRMMPAIQNGTGQYAGTYGLSDRKEVTFKYDVTPGSTAQYYKDLIVNTLREMGYNL